MCNVTLHSTIRQYCIHPLVVTNGNIDLPFDSVEADYSNDITHLYTRHPSATTCSNSCLIVDQVNPLYSTAVLTASLDKLEEASYLGLHVSWQKTKLQNMGAGPSVENITVRRQLVKAVAEFMYLCSTESSDGRCMADITRPIDLAAAAMRPLQTLATAEPAPQ